MLKCDLPQEQQLYELCSISKGSVCGEEDPAIVLFLASRVEQVIDEPVEGSGLQTAYLAGSVLDKGAAWTRLTCTGGGEGLPTQSDPIHDTILKLLTPLLHWILGMASMDIVFLNQNSERMGFIICHDFQLVQVQFKCSNVTSHNIRVKLGREEV